MAEMMVTTYTIGDWTFDPIEPVLRRGNETRRLEDRAARTLAVLCLRRGDVVSRDDLIQTVWSGRSVSANSVAIVVGALRRALDDDAQTPVHILTVPRRGYRLAVNSPPPPNTLRAPRRGRVLIIAVAGAVALFGIAGVVALRSAVPRTELIVHTPHNDTGRSDLDELARALGPVVVDSAVARGDARVITAPGSASAGARTRRVTLRSRLILWNGAPELALSASDPDTGAVLWSSFAAGPPALLARHTRERIEAMQIPAR